MANLIMLRHSVEKHVQTLCWWLRGRYAETAKLGDVDTCLTLLITSIHTECYSPLPPCYSVLMQSRNLLSSWLGVETKLNKPFHRRIQWVRWFLWFSKCPLGISSDAFVDFCNSYQWVIIFFCFCYEYGFGCLPGLITEFGFVVIFVLAEGGVNYHGSMIVFPKNVIVCANYEYFDICIGMLLSWSQSPSVFDRWICGLFCRSFIVDVLLYLSG